MPNGQEDPGLLESLENKVAEVSDEHRATLPEYERTGYDVKVGVAKGTYGFTKSLVSGLVDLTTFCVKLFQADQEAWKKVGFAAWDVTKFVGKNFYYEHIAGAEAKQRYEKELDDKFKAMYYAAKARVVKDWDDAKAKGKEAELISKWSTRGVLEIASLFVGAGEVKAAAEASELSKATKVLEGAEVACDLEKGTDAAKAIQVTSEANKAAEAEKLAQAEKATEAKAAALRAASKEAEREALRKELQAIGKKRAAELRTKGNPAYKSNKERGPVLTILKDKKTGKVFEGLNHPVPPSDLDPILAERLKRFKAKYPDGKYPHPISKPGQHSEIYALNEALKARRAAGMDVTEGDLQDFALYNEKLRGSTPGEPPCCPNCTGLLDGVDSLSGKKEVW